MRKHRCTTLAGTALLALALTAACGGEEFQNAGNGSAADSGYSDDGSDGGGYGVGAGAEDSGEGGDDGYGSDSGSGSEQGSAGGAAKGEPAGTLGVTSTPDLGPVVTDAGGLTLYRFDEDSADPPASRCDGGCARTWPPVRAGDTTAAGRVDPELVGSVERADGTRQLTLAGWPVYRYAEDAKPGDTAGHGVGGTWFAFAPDGGRADGEKPRKDARPAALLRAETNDKLGRKILVDAEGHTLYRFDKDSAWPMKTNCTGSCERTWEPAAPVARNRAEGVDRDLVNSFERPDGSQQLAIDCWLLYRFSGDTEPGDVNGQGAQGVWHAVAPDGKKITS